jgi:hypothetical protein
VFPITLPEGSANVIPLLMIFGSTIRYTDRSGHRRFRIAFEKIVDLLSEIQHSADDRHTSLRYIEEKLPAGSNLFNGGENMR